MLFYRFLCRNTPDGNVKLVPMNRHGQVAKTPMPISLRQFRQMRLGAVHGKSNLEMRKMSIPDYLEYVVPVIADSMFTVSQTGRPHMIPISPLASRALFENRDIVQCEEIAEIVLLHGTDVVLKFKSLRALRAFLTRDIKRGAGGDLIGNADAILNFLSISATTLESKVDINLTNGMQISLSIADVIITSKYSRQILTKLTTR